MYFDDEVEEGSSSPPCDAINYTILNEEDIRRLQDDEISHTSSMLCLSISESRLLLCHYKWNVDKLHEEWFTDEYVVREKVGLLDINNGMLTSSDTNDHNNNNNNTCGICYDDFVDNNAIVSLSCGHPYCVGCWRHYISGAINDSGSGTLSLRCPEFKCNIAVTRDLVKELCSEDEITKYDRFFIRSYVESRKEKFKWCPAPGCDNAVEVVRDGRTFGYDVTCVCLYSFCWSCVEEPHRPADCDLVEKWLKKNSSEAENTKWILAFSKPCPKCKRPIEKNMGCSHMTCGPPCKFQFCWLCLEDWTKHGRRGYNCNSYDKKGEDERMRENAELSLERYAHYFERWASNNKSQGKAVEDLGKVQTVGLKVLSDKVTIPESQLAFIEAGWKQVIECRRVLKWTYAYGYYLEEREPGKKQFFEYLQGQAETCLEKLHACAELELSPFMEADADEISESVFREYQCKMVSLTNITGKHFKELSRALENGLSEVVVHQSATTSETSKKSGKRKNASYSASVTPLHHVARNNDLDVDELWQCDQCTFLNSVRNISCQMCNEQ